MYLLLFILYISMILSFIFTVIYKIRHKSKLLETLIFYFLSLVFTISFGYLMDMYFVEISPVLSIDKRYELDIGTGEYVYTYDDGSIEKCPERPIKICYDLSEDDTSYIEKVYVGNQYLYSYKYIQHNKE